MKSPLIAISAGLLAIESGHAQLVDRASAEIVMRDLMPTNARCERISWEPISYCRYETVNVPNVVFEISFGRDGPSGSLTYDIGNSEGRQFFGKMRLFFSRVGVEEKALDECINQSKLKANEFLAGNLLVKCRYTNFADGVGYEIFTERSR
jgi:hypothetical protein